MFLIEVELYEATVERQDNRGVFKDMWAELVAFCRGPDCAHVVSWCCSCLTLVFLFDAGLHDRADSFFSLSSVYISCSQQVGQQFRMCSLEFCHSVGSVSVVWAPSKTTHRSAHELFIDWCLQCRLPVILEEGRCPMRRTDLWNP